MRVGYTVFPRSGYVLETLRGIVTYQDLARFAARQQLDVRVAPHFHTVSDFSRATLRLTEQEVRLYADTICTLPTGRLGKRALVVFGARNLAIANLLQAFALQSGLQAQCFCDRDAALRWLNESAAEGVHAKPKYFSHMELETAVS
jgi:hypothetical protein